VLRFKKTVRFSEVKMGQETSYAITEVGVIESIAGENAVVRIRKNACCTSCSTRGACEVLNDKEMRIQVPNDIHGTVGDSVEISVPARSLLKLSLLVYFFPVVALVIGAYAGGMWAEALGMEDTLASILCGGLAMAITFYALKRFDRSAQTNSQYTPRMTRILTRLEPPPRPAGSI
jgi:sigma-E factor negative regulatory protein RseC